MIKINNILVAVELDKESEGVIEYGITLGLILDANVRCLHVSRPEASRLIYDEEGILLDNYNDSLDDVVVDDIEDMVDDDLQKLRAMVVTVKNKLSIVEHTVIVNVRSDFAVAGIISEAEETAADLIIVGAHVDYRRQDMGISNLSRSIIDKSTKSVVVVPSTYGNRNLDHICMFINFEFGELTMIQDMIQVATNNGIHLSFIHILDIDEKVVAVEKKLKVYQRLFLQDEEHNLISFTMKTGNIDDIIDDLTNDMDVDLIGLKTQKKHWNLFGLQKAFDTSVLNHIKVPLYIWRR
tara:strand:- start:252 stop:1136 length:885 start_codon:yes stop_codon:yes gene_type:complete